MNEARLISAVARLAPWLATVPTAYAIGHAAYTVIGWPLWVALLTALAVETLGIATSATALELYAYNRAKRKTDPAAPIWLAVAGSGLYFVAVIILTAVLEASAVLALFPLLSLVASLTLALRADQGARLALVDAERAQAAQERALAAQERAQKRMQERSAAEMLAEYSEVRKPAALAAPQATQVLTHGCTACAKTFASQQALAAHMRSHKRASVQVEQPW